MELEEFIGFPIKRREITLETGEPHDESFSYQLCLNFYNDNESLKIAAELTQKRLLNLLKSKDNKEIALNFSLLGDIYYLKEDFEKSLGSFMKALSYNKSDITNWVGLIFSLRALGKVALFEDLIFNFEKVVTTWRNRNQTQMNQKELLLIRKSISQ